MNLHHSKWLGGEYTWCNNQVGEDRIYSRIDRFLANSIWFQTYQSHVVEIMDINISDHCPLSLNIDDAYCRGPGLFRFLNVMTENLAFRKILDDHWHPSKHGNLLVNLWRNLKHLKEPLKALNNSYYKGIDEKLLTSRDALREVQRKMNIQIKNAQLIQQEKDLREDIEKWSNIEEKIWHQKSRIEWLKLGDGNTRFFHAYAKTRTGAKAIKVLFTEGKRCVTHQQMKDEIRTFYMKLMGSASEYLPMIETVVIKRWAVLQDHNNLCDAVTDKEIKEALFNMNPNKAPGIDGFNVHFFQSAWQTIGSDVCPAIQQFFASGRLPRLINPTLITLLPKIENATTVKEFRPIACCSILYKIISKVIANRIHAVLSMVVSDNQSAFIKGRTIFDNILLSHEIIKGYTRKKDISKVYDKDRYPKGL